MDGEPTVLCVDIGTSSLKVALITKNGRIVAYSQQYFACVPPAIIALQWLPALKRGTYSFRQYLRNVRGICISGNGPTIVCEYGTTLLWNAAIPDSICSKTNLSLFLPRIKAFKERYRQQWDNSRFVYSGPEYLIYLLCGNSVSILPEKRYLSAYWTPDALEANGIQADKLPSFAEPASKAGVTKPEITKMLSLPAPVPVICGAPDFVAALVGTNTLSSGALCDCAGSSEGLNLCTDRPVCGNRIRTLPSVVSGLWNAGVLFASGGKRFAEHKATVEKDKNRSVSYSELLKESMRDKHSVGWEILSELANEIKDAFCVLKGAAKDIKLSPFIAVTGGQAKNSSWMQMKANVLNYPLAVMQCPDAELLGDAAFGWKGLGVYTSVREAAIAIAKASVFYTPDMQAQSI